MQLRVLRSGSAVQRPQALEREPLWLGDKKPVQQADPEVLRFTSSLFPDARYVHIVRHPAGAVASMLRRGRKGAAVGFWQRGDAEEVIQRWGVHERWALAASDRVAVHRLRYEDLVRDPVSQLVTLFEFLGLQLPAELAATMSDHTRAPKTDRRAQAELDLSSVRDLMDEYGYTHDLP